MSVPCYVITLSPQSARTQALLASLQAAGVPAQVYLGVDGRRGMPALEGEETLAKLETYWRHKSELTSSEVGCYLSHYRLIREAYTQGHERICIMEDDVEIEPAFAAVFPALVALPEEYEMIRLMALKIRKRKILQSLPEGHSLTRPERGLLGTQGYLINRRGMAKFLAHASRIFEAIDKIYDHFYEFDLRQFGVEPHIILEASEASSVVKSQRAAAVPLWVKVLFPFGKAWRSHVRHRYLRAHHDEFYPAKKPKTRPGRSARLR